jgi:selenocysteine lyase/cysteine desulfurase
MKHFAVAATARASFYVLYNTKKTVDRLVDALAVVGGIFG